ncbi:MAG: methylated-DNA--[protein]-cysteine S-methyltransferase, partial [Calditrichales bacterium]
MQNQFEQENRDYQRIEAVVKYLEDHFKAQPELQDIADFIGLSEFHLQRLFKRWVGISPKRFLQFLTKEYAKTLLRDSGDVLSATYASGLSGPGRLHDLFVSCEAVTPGQYKELGRGLTIYYGFHMTPFGRVLFAETERGVCGLFFIPEGEDQKYLTRLKKDWPEATLVEDGQRIHPNVKKIFSYDNWQEGQRIPLFLHGTNFQIKVWEALLKIPTGNVVAYEQIAEFIGHPGAVRAVGSAVARNPISYLIPCHRVIRKYGDYGNYQGGTARKKALLGWESA